MIIYFLLGLIYWFKGEMFSYVGKDNRSFRFAMLREETKLDLSHQSSQFGAKPNQELKPLKILVHNSFLYFIPSLEFKQSGKTLLRNTNTTYGQKHHILLHHKVLMKE